MLIACHTRSMLLAAVVENYQTEYQKVRVPRVLQPYLGGRTEL